MQQHMIIIADYSLCDFLEVGLLPAFYIVTDGLVNCWSDLQKKKKQSQTGNYDFR
jgi:hypothetical protein